MPAFPRNVRVGQGLGRIATAGLLSGLASAWLLLTLSDEARAGSVSVQFGQQRLFLPSVMGPPPEPEVSPAGAYTCQEHEYGMLYGDTYPVELHDDGTSSYNLGGVMTGTWTYAPSTHVLAFTHFFWITATYHSPTMFYTEYRLPGNDQGTPTRDLFCWRP